jgi:nitrite reductase (NADH) small subunit
MVLDQEGRWQWVEVAPLEAIPRLGARVVQGPDGDIAVFRTALDEVFALRDRCPHRGGPLSQGIVFEKRVACPLHDWVIDLEAGCAVGADHGCAPRYPVRVEAGRVYLGLAPENTADDRPRPAAAAL